MIKRGRMKMSKVRFGIIGLGVQGATYTKFLAENKVKNGILTGLCSKSQEKKQAYEERYPDIPFYTNYIDMLDSKKVDAVIICVPHYLHAEIGIEAIKRDVHILIEKPAGVYSKQVRELNDIALAKPDIAFGIMFNQRMHPLYQKIKNIVENGEIGEIRRTNWISTTSWRPQIYYDQSAWRATWGGEGGGVLVNQAPHQLDLWQWICGMPKKVFAKVQYGFKRNINVEDEVTALVEYENGATGVFITCTHDIMGTDRLEILGDLGKIIVEDSKKITIKRLRISESEISNNTTLDELSNIIMGGSLNQMYDEEILEIKDIWGVQHCRAIENFINHILEDEPLIIKGIEGINEVILSNAIHLSSWLDKEIELPLDEDLFLLELNKKIEDEK